MKIRMIEEGNKRNGFKKKVHKLSVKEKKCSWFITEQINWMQKIQLTHKNSIELLKDFT